MCSNSSSYLATDDFYLTGLHVLTAIEIPVHFFGAFIIVARSPKKMSNVKWTMLILHLVGAFLDFYLSFIASPVLTLPMCAGYPLGVSLILGIPTSIQVYLGISFVGVIGVTILGFFEDRYHRLAHGHISNGKRNWKRKLWLFFHYCLSMVFIAPGYFSIPEQELGTTVMKKLIPCIPSEIFARQGFFVLATNNLIPCLCLIFMAIVLFIQLNYFIIAIQRFLRITVGKSQSTNRLQRQFFIALCTQVAVPLFVLAFPVLYIILSIWFDYYNQAYTNIAMLSLAVHGIASTITMLIVHKPYRDATLTIFHMERKKTTGEQTHLWKTRMGGASVLL